MNQVIRFRLDLSYDRYLLVYRGSAKTIRTRADDGRIIEFPAGRIQVFLNENGIHGYFEMEFSAANKFVDIRKIG